jgi:hypothetical protein
VQGINDVFGSAGWRETLVAVTSATYAPATIAQLASATIQTAHTMLHTATGCYGDLNITATAGREMRATYTGQGLYSAPTIGSIGTWSVGTTGVNRAIAYKGVTGTIANGVDAWATPTVQSFTFRAGNDIRQIPDAFSATGLKKLFFADRNPTAEIVFALDTDTTGVIIQADEFYTNWLASTTWDVQLVHGATPGNINTFNADTAQVVNVQEGEGDGFRTLTASLKLQHSTAEAEYSLVQT